jgi:hypothetical protein
MLPESLSPIVTTRDYESQTQSRRTQDRLSPTSTHVPSLVYLPLLPRLSAILAITFTSLTFVPRLTRFQPCPVPSTPNSDL